VRYFLGDAVEVYAHATTAFNKKLANLVPGYTIDDAMTTSVKFANGALATILASVATPVGGGVSLNVYGTRTAATFRGWGHEVTISRKDGEEVTTEEVASQGDIFAVEDRAFLDAVQTGDASKIRTDYADGFKTSQLTVGANQSAATGKPVDLTQ
jgi:predicted dehydrogenase